jgi:hypothetical protein
VRFSVAFNNKASGFYNNHHPVGNVFYNNTSIGNGYGFNMLGIDPSGAAINLGILRNNIAYGGTLVTNVSGADDANNSWNLGVSVTTADFQSVSTEGWDAPRLPDGSLPPLPQFHLVKGSDLIDKGVKLGLPYTGAAPDLGAFEGSTPVPLYTDVTARILLTQSGLTVDRATSQQRGTVSITNTSNSIITGSILFRLDGLADGVTLVNAAGVQGGAPTLTLPKASLAPGETVTVTTVFSNPARASIGYTPKLFAAVL